MKSLNCLSYLFDKLKGIPRLIDNFGSDFFLGKVTDKLIRLLLCDIRDSLMLVEIIAVLVNFSHKLLVSLNKV